jgi:hypothetical protein
MHTIYRTITTIALVIMCHAINAQVGINTDNSQPDNSAMLEVKSTVKGFLPPRMTEIQRDAISSPAEGLQIFNTTTKRPNYFNGSVWTHFDGTAAQALSIGDFHAGGVVFWLDGNGGGLVCTITELEYNGDNTWPWGCFATEIVGADEWDIGTGAQNTIDIIGSCSWDNIPAKICSVLSLNGFSDWFLPSKEELNEMWLNRIAINATAQANGGNGFITYWYSSSTEFDINNAWALNFDSGNQTDYHKAVSCYFRAIRAF